MKKLFIYYSLTGNGDVVSDKLRDRGYDIRKVINKHKYPKNKFLMIMTGGYRALLNKKDKLKNFDSDISKYDEVVIGTPIWNDRISCSINTVLSNVDLSDKKVTFILYSGSGVANKAIERISNTYKAKTIVLKEPKKCKEELKKLDLL